FSVPTALSLSFTRQRRVVRHGRAPHREERLILGDSGGDSGILRPKGGNPASVCGMIEAARRVAKLPRMTHSDPTRGMQSYPGRSGAAAVGIPRTRASWAVVPVIAGLLL